MQDLPENHIRVSGVSLENIISYWLLYLSKLCTIKSKWLNWYGELKK